MSKCCAAGIGTESPQWCASHHEDLKWIARLPPKNSESGLVSPSLKLEEDDPPSLKVWVKKSSFAKATDKEILLR